MDHASALAAPQPLKWLTPGRRPARGQPRNFGTTLVIINGFKAFRPAVNYARERPSLPCLLFGLTSQQNPRRISFSPYQKIFIKLTFLHASYYYSFITIRVIRSELPFSIYFHANFIQFLSYRIHPIFIEL